MKKLKKIFAVIILLLILSIYFTTQKVFANKTTAVAEKVEYTEEYKNWLELSEDEKKEVLIPRMYEVPYRKTSYTNPLLNARILKANNTIRFSLKDIIPENLLIKNQQLTNSCWAFARLSSLETNLALANYKTGINQSKVYDFSERHMEYATSRYFLNDEENETGYNRTVGDGGTHIMADAYLANGYGAIPESEMPFENNENIIDISEIQNKTISSQLYDTIEFPDYNSETGENRTVIINQIKQHIQDYGAVYAPLHGDSASTTEYSCYNNTTGAKYCNNESEHPANHAVSIIGWDDDYSRDDFCENAKPTSNGAWIVRNSWGESNEIGTIDQLRQWLFSTYNDQCISQGWNTPEEIPDEFINEGIAQNGWIMQGDKVYEKYGDNGLIYVSYEDVNISKELSGIVKATDVINYDNLYAYDELGPSQGIKIKGSTIMLSNTFNKKSQGTEYLTQVSLYAMDTYTCKVYVNPNGTSKTKEDLQLVSLKSGDSKAIKPGYHTLELSKPVEINADNFTVAIEIQSTTSQTTFALEAKPTISINNPYSNVITEKGKCFVTLGNDLETYEWYDLGTLSESGLGILLPNGDSTIKAYTTLELIDESLKNIEIVTPPNKTAYFEGEDFDKTGMVVKANYNSKTNPSVILDSSNYNITNGTNLQEGQASVTITYEDKSVEQPISVEKNNVTEIRIKTPPTKTEYKEGESFDKTNMVVEAIYKDGTTKQISDYIIKNGSNLKANQTEVIISYADKEVSQNITVTPNPLMEIKITKEPNKTKYVAGQNFDKTGMVVIGRYEDGSEYEIIEYIVEKGENLTKEQTSVTIRYENQTVTQNITVEEKVITSILIEKTPSKLTYIQNKENLDLTGGSLKVIYNDETEETIALDSEEIDITGFDNTKLGKQSITVTYKDKTTQFEIEIIEEAKAENSNLDNGKCDVNKLQIYLYTQDVQKEYMIINVTINDIERNLNNDEVEYYYYLSSNKEEQNINDWVKVTEEQNENNKLQFAIDSRKISNFAELTNEEELYLYIKEVALKGGNQSISISKAMQVYPETQEIDIYVDDVKIVDGNNSGNNGSIDNSTRLPIRLPNAGIKSILAVLFIVTIVGAVFYIRYKKLNKYVK